MTLGRASPLTGNKQFYLTYWNRGEDTKKEMVQSKQQCGKISCAALIGLTQVGKAALL